MMQHHAKLRWHQVSFCVHLSDRRGSAIPEGLETVDSVEYLSVPVTHMMDCYYKMSCSFRSTTLRGSDSGLCRAHVKLHVGFCLIKILIKAQGGICFSLKCDI